MPLIRVKSVCLTVLAAVAGCAAPAPDAGLDLGAAGARGVDAISFTAVGEPVDAGEPTGSVLNISEATRRAVTHDPRVQAALARLHAARAGSRQARLLPNPVLSVVVRFPETGDGTTIEAGLAAELVRLLSRPGQISAADNRLRAAAADATSQVLDVIVEVAERYASAQSSDAALIVLHERRALAERLLELARSRLELGEGTRLDVLTLQTQRVELEAEIAERQLERQTERVALARLIGEPSSAADWQLSPWEPVADVTTPESDWVSMALARRPDVLAREYEVAALGAELSVTRLSAFDGAEVGVDAERDAGDWSAGPAVSTPVPLFDFGQARRSRARAALAEARHNLTRARRQAVEETRRAYASFKASMTNLARVREELIPLLQRRLEQAEAQFKAGQVGATDLLLAQQELRAAQTRLIELRRRNTESLVRLHRAVGGAGVAKTVEEILPASQPSPQPDGERSSP